MSNHQTAEIIGTHMALSTPVAKAWRRVSLGEISTEEAMALMESDEERELARRLFTPPTPERREALLAALLARVADEEARGGSEDEPTRGAKPRVLSWRRATAPSRTEGLGQPAPRSRPWRRRGLALAALMVAAVLISILPRPHEGLSTAYTLDPLQGDAVWRGSTEATRAPSYSRASRLHIVLRPREPVEGAVAVVVFARSPDGRSAVLELEPRIAANGLVSIDVPMRDTGLDEGDWELVFVVGRPGTLPSSWGEIELGIPASEEPEYQVLRTPIRVVAQSGGT